MFELHELEGRIQQHGQGIKIEELRTSFDRLKTNVKEVQADLVEHQRMQDDRRRSNHNHNGNFINGDSPIKVYYSTDLKSADFNHQSS